MRVYFDTNVYTKIKNDGSSSSVLEEILSSKDRICYLYSKAHILDLQIDKTDEKFEDLDMILRIAGNNYLYNYWKTPTNWFDVYPHEAYSQIKEDQGFTDIFEDFDFSQLEDKFEPLRSALENFDPSQYQNDKMPQFLKDQMSMLMRFKEDQAPPRFTDESIELHLRLFSDPSLYRELRRYMIENKNLIFDGNCDNDDLDVMFRNSVLGKGFDEYIEDNIFSGDNIQNRYTSDYIALSSLALDGEKNRKVRFQNTFVDSLHSYFGSHCDVIVSQDAGLRTKTKKLHERLGLQILVMTLDEYASYIKMLMLVNESFQSNVDDVMHDIQKKNVVRNEDLDGDLVTTIKCTAHKLYAFGNIQMHLPMTGDVLEKIQGITMVPTKKIGKIIHKKEISKTVELLLQLLGEDLQGSGAFADDEFELVKNSKWNGRVWRSNIGNLSFSVCRNSFQIYFHIGIEIDRPSETSTNSC